MLFRGSGFRCDYCRFFRSVDTCSSISNKKHELYIKVYGSSPPVIGVTKYCANKDVTGVDMVLNGYVLFREDRMGRRGEGVF